MTRPPGVLSRAPRGLRWGFVLVAMVAIVVGLAVLGARVASNTRADQAQERAIRTQARLNAEADVAACRTVLYVNSYIMGLREVFSTGSRADQPLVRDLIALGDRITRDTTICDLAARSVGHAIRPLKPHP